MQGKEGGLIFSDFNIMPSKYPSAMLEFPKKYLGPRDHFQHM